MYCWRQNCFVFNFVLTFRSPWASNVDFEIRHRKIFQDIGTSLQGKFYLNSQNSFKASTVFVYIDLGFTGYLLLYASTLYNINETTISNWKLSEKDQRVIKRVN